MSRFHSLQDKDPMIASMFDAEKNGRTAAETGWSERSTTYWWSCKTCGEQWQDSPYHMVSHWLSLHSPSHSCYAGQPCKTGMNDLETMSPAIASEFVDTARDHEITPSQIAWDDSEITVWWKCPACGIQWSSKTIERTRRCNPKSCPVCNHGWKSYKPGVNDLETMDPEEARLWDYDLNGKLTPSRIYARAVNVRYWRRCAGGKHPSELRIPYSRKMAYCCRQGANEHHGWRKGTGILVIDVWPQVLQWFDSSLNTDVDIRSLRVVDDHAMNWKCVSCGEIWQAKASTVARHDGVCNSEYVSRQTRLAMRLLVLDEFHSVMEDDHVIDWDADANVMDPRLVPVTSREMAWWKCHDCGRRWQSRVFYVCSGRGGCPSCLKSRVGSRMEEEIAACIRGMIPAGQEIRVNDRNALNGKEIDVYLPSLKLGFEANGLYWHSEKYKGKSYHEDKWQLARSNGIDLFWIWEDDWRDDRLLVEDLIRRVINHKLNMDAGDWIDHNSSISRTGHVEDDHHLADGSVCDLIKVDSTGDHCLWAQHGSFSRWLALEDGWTASNRVAPRPFELKGVAPHCIRVSISDRRLLELPAHRRLWSACFEQLVR